MIVALYAPHLPFTIYHFIPPRIIQMTHFGGQKSNYGNNLNNPNCNALENCIAVLSPLDHQDFEQLLLKHVEIRITFHVSLGS